MWCSMSNGNVVVECVVETRNRFGESPVWSPADQALYWVDVTAPAVFRYRPRERELRQWAVPEDIGSIGLRRDGGFVAGMRSGLFRIDPARGWFEPIAAPEPAEAGTRFNDGKCDRAGRFWSGTMDDKSFAPIGKLYRLAPNGDCRQMGEGFIIINGIAWSPDNRLMYVADSRREIVYAYDFDLATGEIAARRQFISTEDIPGRVDGATVDTTGCYWCAHVRGGEVAQYDPDGRRVRRIKLPVLHPLMCNFGGPDLDVLYVTTATALLTADEVAGQPLAGALFAIYGTGARGVAEPEFGG
jgi:L-arabinonolactonase